MMNLTINIENGVVSIFSNKDVKQLKEIKDRLDRMEAKLIAIQQLLTPMRYIPAELERAIRKVSKSVEAIDQQVPDEEE